MTETSKSSEHVEGQKEEEEEVGACVQGYDCVICGQTTSSTEDRPVGMVTLLQATSGIRKYL